MLSIRAMVSSQRIRTLSRPAQKHGIVFIGPSEDIMNAMGDKISSKQMAIKAGVPIIPGVDHALKSEEEVIESC